MSGQSKKELQDHCCLPDYQPFSSPRNQIQVRTTGSQPTCQQSDRRTAACFCSNWHCAPITLLTGNSLRIHCPALPIQPRIAWRGNILPLNRLHPFPRRSGQTHFTEYVLLSVLLLRGGVGWVWEEHDRENPFWRSCLLLQSLLRAVSINTW